MESSSAPGAGTNRTTVQAGSELRVDAGGLNIPTPLTLGGAGINGADGALNASANAVNSTWSGPISAATNTTILAASGAAVTLSGIVNAGTNTLEFLPQGTIVVSGNVTAQTLQLNSSVLNSSGQVALLASNSLSNVAILVPRATLWACNSNALGTNSTVLLTNGITPGIGCYLNLGSNNVTIPAGVSLVAQVPGGGLGSPASYRAYLDLGAPGDTTNTWNGPISMTGTDPLETGVPGYFIIQAVSGNAVINGTINVPAGQSVNLQVRGGGNGILNGKINLDTNAFTRTDAGPWTIASSANIWGQTIVFGGPLMLGINEALPANAPLRLDAAASILDLNGFSQHVPGLTNTGNTVWGVIRNSSTNAASTLIYQGGSSFFGGSLQATAGAQPLHLDVAGGVLSLLATNTYSGNTTIRNGATLALSGGGLLSATPFIDVQAGGTLDLSPQTAGSYTLGSGLTIMGSGSVLGNLTANGGVMPGDSLGGVLTVSGDLALGSSAVATLEVNPTASTNNLLSVGGTLTYGGALLITKLGPAPYAPNAVFKLFSASAYSGSFANITFPGVPAWDASRLPVDGTIKVLSVVPATPTNISFAIIGGTNLQMSWPPTYVGWPLQMQTNAPGTGLSTNWFTVPGSITTNVVTVPIIPANGSAFFRMVHP